MKRKPNINILFCGIDAVIWKKISILLLISVLSSEYALSGDTGVTPFNTVILSNETDGDFCKDFSVILDRLAVDWVYLKTPDIPDKIKDKNIIILGGPDAPCTGDIVKGLLTETEMYLLRQHDIHCTFSKDSPWAHNRTIFICAGSTRVFTKVASEEGIHSIIEQSDDPAQWLHPPFGTAPEEPQSYINQYLYIPDDEELPAEELAAALVYDYNLTVSSEDAIKDVGHLFYLLSHGYSGYGFFKTRGDFNSAQIQIVKELEKRPEWSLEDFSELIHTHLQFIHDGHFMIGHNYYHQHKDFYSNRGYEIWKTEGEYYFIHGSERWKIVEINYENPEKYVYPSLNAAGEPIYVLGTLSSLPPSPIVLTAESTAIKNFEIQLYRSAAGPIESPSRATFEEKRISGIPVVCIRSFFDSPLCKLDDFLSTAEKYKEESYLVLDIRSNGGGNSVWGQKWVETFTGHTPDGYFINTMFISRTTLMGKINMCRILLRRDPYNTTYKTYLKDCEEQLSIFEESQSNPYWTELFLPDIHAIRNSTTVIVLTDGWVASAGEDFIGVLRQMENVIVVGENTAGGCIFGDLTLHQLPRSKLQVKIPYQLFFPVDLQFIEEEGLYPDLWVPAGDALDYVITAIQKRIL